MAAVALLAGRYRHVSPIGRGGMGEVWLAEDELLQRRVAIKRIHAGHGALDPTSLERVMREARLAARLDHPNAVTVHDLVVEDGQPHLIMQYVEGRSLSETIESGPLPTAAVARIGAAVAAALAEAHELGIVHRDVKPANILIDARGRALLADFGIARSDSDVALTQTGLFIGTPGFLAPEIARGGQASAASDVYALGATLYAAVEGRAPFAEAGANTLAVLARILTQPVPPPTRAGALTGLVEAMLHADPSQRPTAAQVAEHLADLPVADEPKPALVAAAVPASDTTRLTPPPDASDPLDTLLDAIIQTEDATRGWSAGPEEWSDLIHEQFAQELRPGEFVDLFVPALFRLDPGSSVAFPPAVRRALRTLQPGAVATTQDRLISAWYTGGHVGQTMSLSLAYAAVGRVDEAVDRSGDEAHALVVAAGVGWAWPVFFSNEADLARQRRLLVGRLRGAIVPEWRAGRVARWHVADGRGAWSAEPGWSDDQ